MRRIVHCVIFVLIPSIDKLKGVIKYSKTVWSWWLMWSYALFIRLFDVYSPWQSIIKFAFNLGRLSRSHDRVRFKFILLLLLMLLLLQIEICELCSVCADGTSASLRFDCLPLTISIEAKYGKWNDRKQLKKRNWPKTFTFRPGYKRGACDVRIHL